MQNLEDDVDQDAQEQQPIVGQKRGASGGAAFTRTSSSQAPGVVELTPELEDRLCDLVNELLLEQRYVDEWKVDGIQRWLKEKKSLDLSMDLLEKYFDRVDQQLPVKSPHVLYDVAEKAVHRDY